MVLTLFQLYVFNVFYGYVVYICFCKLPWVALECKKDRVKIQQINKQTIERRDGERKANLKSVVYIPEFLCLALLVSCCLGKWDRWTSSHDHAFLFPHVLNWSLIYPLSDKTSGEKMVRADR